jgi:hypothetical protein
LPAPTDTPEPVETPAPVETLIPTDTPEATGTPEPTGAPEPTNTPASANASPASTESAAGDAPTESTGVSATGITPGTAGSGDPGASVTYSHLVTNLGDHAEAINVTAGSSSGWSVALLGTDGTTPLLDLDGDGVPETSSLAPGESLPIVVAVVVPPDAPAVAVDVTTVTASSADNPGTSASASDVTTVNPVLVLTAAPTELTFGLVAADGPLDPSVPGIIASAADATGAWYVLAAAIQVTVASNAPWTGTCSATENTGSATTVTIAEGRLEWRLAGAEAWTPFAVAGASWPNTAGCFPFADLGTTTLVYDVRLRIEATDPPGTFSTRITFAATP